MASFVASPQVFSSSTSEPNRLKSYKKSIGLPAVCYMEGKPVLDRHGRAGEEEEEEEEARESKSSSLPPERKFTHSPLLEVILEDSGKEEGDAAEVLGTSRSSCSSPSTGSTVTSEENQWNCKGSMEVSSIVLGGCTRCHMYVMIHREKLRCPRCFSSSVVNFFQG